MADKLYLPYTKPIRELRIIACQNYHLSPDVSSDWGDIWEETGTLKNTLRSAGHRRLSLFFSTFSLILVEQSSGTAPQSPLEYAIAKPPWEHARSTAHISNVA